MVCTRDRAKKSCGPSSNHDHPAHQGQIERYKRLVSRPYCHSSSASIPDATNNSSCSRLAHCRFPLQSPGVQPPHTPPVGGTFCTRPCMYVSTRMKILGGHPITVQETGCGARIKGAGWFGFATCAWGVVNKSPRPAKQTGNGRKQGGNKPPQK